MSTDDALSRFPLPGMASSCESEEFLDALLSADRLRAVSIAKLAVQKGSSVEDVHVGIIKPAMVRIGELWADGQISIAAEHSATIVTQYVMMSLYPFIRTRSADRGSAIVAGVAGELHQLGAHMVSDALEADGWQVCFLGADRSCADIADACLRQSPKLLALSCTIQDNLDQVERVIGHVQALALPTSPRFLVGGLGFGAGLQAHQLARRLGADALAHDLAGAVAVARAWSEADRLSRVQDALPTRIARSGA